MMFLLISCVNLYLCLFSPTIRDGPGCGDSIRLGGLSMGPPSISRRVFGVSKTLGKATTRSMACLACSVGVGSQQCGHLENAIGVVLVSRPVLSCFPARVSFARVSAESTLFIWAGNFSSKTLNKTRSAPFTPFTADTVTSLQFPIQG